MPQKGTYQHEGKTVTGESVKVTAASEPWAEFTLEDGTTVKAKMVLLDVVRLDTFNAAGDPVYQFQLQYIVGANAPAHLKKPVEAVSAKPVQ